MNNKELLISKVVDVQRKFAEAVIYYIQDLNEI